MTTYFEIMNRPIGDFSSYTTARKHCAFEIKKFRAKYEQWFIDNGVRFLSFYHGTTNTGLLEYPRICLVLRVRDPELATLFRLYSEYRVFDRSTLSEANSLKHEITLSLI